MVGMPMFFVRFAGCNLKCSWCDTKCDDRFRASIDEIVEKVLHSSVQWVCLTGGEPSLQVDIDLVDALHEKGIKIAIETNGTCYLPLGIDWITVSPKREDSIVIYEADEVKCVIEDGDLLPSPIIKADHYLLSPVFDGMCISAANIEWCIELVKRNPKWRLSIQMHKLIGVA